MEVFRIKKDIPFMSYGKITTSISLVTFLFAVFFLATSVSGLALAGVDNWVESLFNGCALVLAVGLSTVLGRRLSGG